MNVLWTHSGTPFAVPAASCSHPERLAHLVGFLNWLSPLGALAKEDQHRLGLLAAHARPAIAEDEEPAEEETLA